MEVSDNQKYCLKWNNFQSNFTSQFETLKEDEDFVDVTLSCYGQSIKAHKVVLSACSPYLKNIFKEHPCKHPVIILDNLSFKNLEAVIQFVYTGQVYVEQAELSSFLKAAETLQIRGLSDPSATQSLIEQPILPQNLETDNVKISKKRESEDENEIKKASSKKISRKVLSSCVKDSNEVKDKEKDCSSNNDNKAEGNSESSSLNLMVEMEYSFDGDDRGLTLSSKSDELSTNEQKKPHWLDPRSCPLCNRVYSNLSNLRQHMKLIHNPTLVTCKLCYKTFKTDLYLRRHLISFHELSASGNNLVSIEPLRPVQNHPPPWNQNIKSEPDAFNEIFNGGEMYQVPQ